MPSTARLPLIALALALTLAGCQSQSPDRTVDPAPVDPFKPSQPALVEFHVAPNGAADAPGTAERPASLLAIPRLLRATQRSAPGVLRVWLHGGLYLQKDTLELSAADAGTQANPIEYVAWPGESPRLAGAVSIPTSSLKPIPSSDPNLGRAPSDTVSRMKVADLSSLAGKLGTLDSRQLHLGAGNQASELWMDGAPMLLARTPDPVAPDQVQLAEPDMPMVVQGAPVPDVTGEYRPAGRDGRGRPLYQLAKLGKTWTLHAVSDRASWQISCTYPVDTPYDQPIWRGDWGYAGPAGRLDPLGAYAKGTLMVRKASGTPMLPGFMTIESTDGSTTLQSREITFATSRVGELMACGYFHDSWAAHHLRVKQLSPGTLVLARTPDGGIRVGQPFYFYNALEALNRPDEYYLDLQSNRLYLAPDHSPGELLLSLMDTPLVRLKDCAFVQFRGITFEAGRKNLVVVEGGHDLRFRSCRFRNTGALGLELDGLNHLVDDCTFQDTGKSCIQVSGGNRFTLAPSGHVIQNCRFFRSGRLFPTYHPAIRLQSFTSEWQEDNVGTTIQNCLFQDHPQAAIHFHGNNHIIRNNRFQDCCRWSSDSGVVYTGRDWGARGTLIQQNLFLPSSGPMGTFVAAVYLDDTAAGIRVEANAFYASTPSFAILHGGGRDNIFLYNMFEDHDVAVLSDDRAATWIPITDTPGSDWNFLEKIQRFHYQQPPWSTAYPGLAAMPPTLAELKASPHWLEPEGSVYFGNVHHGRTPRFFRENDCNKWYLRVERNTTDLPVGFRDPSRGDFTLLPSSPLWQIPGFPGFDPAKIGPESQKMQ